MSFKDIDFEAAFRRLADRRIDEAMQEGKFDNLPGKGQPLDLEPMPADENARMTWWAIRLLRRNEVTPHEVQWRKRIDQLKDKLHLAREESTVRAMVRQINELVHKVNTLGTNPLNAAVWRLDEEAEVERWRVTRGA